MAGYMIALVQLRDTDWVDDYMANVPAIIESYGGCYLARGGGVEQWEGTSPVPEVAAMFKFPSTAVIKEFLACEAYAPYAAARRASADTEILIFESD